MPADQSRSEVGFVGGESEDGERSAVEGLTIVRQLVRFLNDSGHDAGPDYGINEVPH